jgi:hypothetical protein
MEELYKKYYYPSENKFYQILKEHNISVTHKEVKDFISKQNVSQIHKPVLNIKSNLLSIVAFSENEDWQIDLLDYSKYKKSNKNYSWILIAVDVFSRKAYAQPCQKKTPSDILNAFLEMKVKPKIVTHDDGKEYKGVFNQYLEKEGIINRVINSKFHHTLGIVDRFSRTLKNIIEKDFTYNNSVNWINNLQKIINVYNSSPNSGNLNIKPNDSRQEENKAKLSNANFYKAVHNNEILEKRTTLQVGDKVRIKIKKTLLSKGYTNNYSKTIYHIIEVLPKNEFMLNNHKNYNYSDLLKVDNMSESVSGDKQKESEQQNKTKRFLQREGIS